MLNKEEFYSIMEKIFDRWYGYDEYYEIFYKEVIKKYGSIQVDDIGDWEESDYTVQHNIDAYWECYNRKYTSFVEFIYDYGETEWETIMQFSGGETDKITIYINLEELFDDYIKFEVIK